MEFDIQEHEEQQEPAGIQIQLQPPGNNFRKTGDTSIRYKECLKNHAVAVGGQAVDGCGEFMAAGDDGTLDALKCAACNCHRNFHRKEIDSGIHRQQPLQHHFITSTPYYHQQQHHHQHRPSGYLQMKPSPSPNHHQYHHQHQQQPRPLALPSTSREDLEEISNPSSSGGGGGGSKKRFRTKFTAEQKDRMVAFSEALGWRIQKQDEGAVQQFCAETGVKRHVLKVWMHNNKHTIGKKP